MHGYVTLAGFTLTKQDWEELDDESRALLAPAAAPPLEPELLEEPYAAYELSIEIHHA